MQTLLDSLFPQQDAFEPSGYVFTIRATPDLFTGESVNLGVGIIDDSGRRYCRVIEEPGRLECFYGKEGAETLLFLAQVASQAALRGGPAPSPNLRFDEPTPFFNLSATDALASFFRDQVTAAIPLRTNDESAVEMLDTESLRAKVYAFIRLNAKLGVDAVIPQSPLVIANTSKGPRSVRVPLQPTNGAGALESAAYSPLIVKMHLMDALLDIECAAEARQLKRLGMFIARPPRQAPEKYLRQIDEAIDYVVGRAPSHCRIEVETEPESLAEKIMDWADLRAA